MKNLAKCVGREGVGEERGREGGRKGPREGGCHRPRHRAKTEKSHQASMERRGKGEDRGIKLSQDKGVMKILPN